LTTRSAKCPSYLSVSVPSHFEAGKRDREREGGKEKDKKESGRRAMRDTRLSGAKMFPDMKV
jgi:hypothetical protein